MHTSPFFHYKHFLDNARQELGARGSKAGARGQGQEQGDEVESGEGDEAEDTKRRCC